MMPTYNPGDVVIDRPADELRPGEVITFRHSDLSTDVVTHRITDLSRVVIHTKGDANPTPDVWDIRPNQVVGTAVERIPHLGYLLVYLRQPAGVASVMTGVLALIALWGLFFRREPA
jgi:signal peptidase